MTQTSYALDPAANGVDFALPWVAQSVQIDNPTGQWWYVPGAGQFCAPYTVGAVFNLIPSSPQARIIKTGPPGSLSSPKAGELGSATFDTAPSTETAGFSVGNQATITPPTNIRFKTLAVASPDTTPVTLIINNPPGAYNFTVPLGVFFINVKLWGLGGGGGGASAGIPGAGGGGGGYSETDNIPVIPGQIIPYVIGANGPGGGVGIAGGNGGDTSWNGGQVLAKGGFGGASGAGTRVGGNGGSAAAGVGAIRNGGGSGANSQNVVADGGGGGGGSAGDTSNGGGGNTSFTAAGGTGGTAGTTNGVAGGNGASNVGGAQSGFSPGGGGGGGSQAFNTGGNGGSANLIIISYIPSLTIAELFPPLVGYKFRITALYQATGQLSGMQGDASSEIYSSTGVAGPIHDPQIFIFSPSFFSWANDSGILESNPNEGWYTRPASGAVQTLAAAGIYVPI